MPSPVPPAATPFRELLDAQDIQLFAAIKSQSKAGDRASWLALQAACAKRFGAFDYLEIGSHLGGSLQALVRDDRVRSIVSIDLRPEQVWDERGKFIRYPGNSTQRMLEQLGAIPGADIDKVHTIDADTSDLAPVDIPSRPHLSFIDGEHTHEAALRDARFCRSIAAPDGVIAFHDSGIIFKGIAQFLRELRASGERFVAYPLPDSVFVVELGGAGIHGLAPMSRLLAGPQNTFAPHPDLLARRAADDSRPVRRLLLALWLSELGVGVRARNKRIHRMRKRWRRQRKRWAHDRKHLKRATARLRRRWMRNVRKRAS